MNAKSLITLSVLAIVLVAAAVTMSRRETTAPSTAIGKLLLPDLPVNAITRVTVAGASSTTVVERIEGAWTVREKFGYPANFGRVRDALIRLAEIKIGDVRPASEKTRRAIGMTAPGADNPESLTVSLENADGKRLAELLLGKMHMRKARGDASPVSSEYPDGRYVSLDNGANIYVVKETLNDFADQAMGWLDNQILHVDEGQITAVTITGPDREALALARAAEGDTLTLPGLTDAEELDPTKLSSLRNALSYLTFQDIAAPATNEADRGLAAPVVFDATTADNRRYELRIGATADGGTRYVRCQVAFVAPPAPDPASSNAVAEAAAIDQSRRETEELNRKLAPWTFLIPTYKTDAMTVTRADLVKPKASTPPEAASAPSDLSAPSDASNPPAPVEPPAPPAQPIEETNTP